MGQAWLSKDGEKSIYGSYLNTNFKGDAKSHIIYFVKQIGNKNIKFSCKTNKPTTAYRFANHELQDRLKKPRNEKLFKLTIEDAVAKFLEEKHKDVLAEDLEIGTYRGTANSLKYLLEFFSGNFVEIFEKDSWPDKWDEFTAWYKSKYNGQTIFNVVKYTRSLTIFLHKKGFISKRPEVVNRFAKKESLSAKKKRQRIFTKKELENLLKASKILGDREYLFVALGYYLAFRIGDCCELEWKRVFLSEADPYISFEGDDKVSTFVKNPMPEVLRIALLKYKEEQKSLGRWVFPQTFNPNQPIKRGQFEFPKILEKASIDFGTFHTLRHTRLSLDFGNPKLSHAHVMIMRRVSYEVALEHYIHPNEESRKQVRTHSYEGDILL